MDLAFLTGYGPSVLSDIGGATDGHVAPTKPSAVVSFLQLQSLPKGEPVLADQARALINWSARPT